VLSTISVALRLLHQNKHVRDCSQPARPAATAGSGPQQQATAAILERRARTCVIVKVSRAALILKRSEKVTVCASHICQITKRGDDPVACMCFKGIETKRILQRWECGERGVFLNQNTSIAVLNVYFSTVCFLLKPPRRLYQLAIGRTDW
jgi:hypothetical protein